MLRLSAAAAKIRGRGALATIIFSVAAASLLVPAALALAHPTGQSLNQNVGDYVVDIGYDSITPSPVAGEATAFDFRFFHNPGSQLADYTDVGVSILASDGSTAFYGDLRHVADSPTGMVYIFPTGGNYKLTAYYKKDGAALAQASFPLVVSQADYQQPPQSPKRYWTNFMSGAIVGVIGLGLIITLADYFKGRKKKKR